MKRFFPLFFILVMGIYFVQFLGCAPSKPPTESNQSSDEDDMGEIERLLGITDEDKADKPEKKQATATNKEDDDLLTLLKADEDKGTTTPTTTAGGDPRLKHLQQQVQDLEGQLVEKNRTIADLKAQVMMKEEELKNVNKAQPTSTPQSSPTQYYSAGTGGSSQYEQDYNHGLDLFHSNQYRDAITVFESLLSQDRNNSLSDNAQYWIGECNFALGSYRAAILAFEKVFTFTQSNKNDYAQYKLGLCYYNMGDYDRAREEFQNLLDNYSNPELIDRAHDYLARLEGQ